MGLVLLAELLPNEMIIYIQPKCTTKLCSQHSSSQLVVEVMYLPTSPFLTESRTEAKECSRFVVTNPSKQQQRQFRSSLPELGSRD